MTSTVGLLYPGHAAADDFSQLATRFAGRVRLPVVHTVVGEDAHEVGALLDLGSPERLAEGARELLAHHPDSVMWACTSGSFVFGPVGARRQADALAALVGCPASSTSIAFAEALRFLGLTRVAVAASYPDDVASSFAEFLAADGVDVVHVTSHGIYTAAEVGTLDRRRVLAMVGEADRPSAQAVLVPDTAMHSLGWLTDLEAAAGKPVLTANQVTVWQGLRLAGVQVTESGLGALFARRSSGGPGGVSRVDN